MVYAGILAAGLGIRMHRQDMPKQFLPLGSKPIIIHTLEQFFINSAVDRIIVIAPENWIPYTEDLIKRHNLAGKDYTVISGGANKAVSISMSAMHIQKTWGVSNKDILVAHDAIRPFITQRLIDENIKTAQKHGAANTAIVMNDTIMVSKDGKNVHEISPFGQMFAEQTPQTYSLPKLMHMFSTAAASGILLEHDPELPRLWLRLGETLPMVKGEYFNMKIINPYDLEVANALLKERDMP